MGLKLQVINKKIVCRECGVKPFLVNKKGGAYLICPSCKSFRKINHK